MSNLTCRICDHTGPDIDFTKDQRSCLVCERLRHRQQNKTRDIERVRAHRQKPANLRARVEHQRAQSSTRHARAVALCRRETKRLVKEGWLARPDRCEECGEPDKPFRDGRSGIQAHHEDYNMPAGVVWLCQVCHKRKHRSLMYPSEVDAP